MSNNTTQLRVGFRGILQLRVGLMPPLTKRMFYLFSSPNATMPYFYDGRFNVDMRKGKGYFNSVEDAMIEASKNRFLVEPCTITMTNKELKIVHTYNSKNIDGVN